MTSLIEKSRELWEHDDLPEELAWVDKLSPRHQRLFFAELQYQWGLYCATKDQHPSRMFFDDWIATAEADADPEHSKFLLGEKSQDDYDEWKAAS